MPVKVNVGLSKKIGQPDYGSLGASCHVEFELDGSYDNGRAEHFQEAVRRAYVACRQAVESEIVASKSPQNGIGGQHSSTPVNRVDNDPPSHPTSGNGNVRNATASQVRAIFAIANRNRVDLPGLLSSQFGVSRPDDLSIRQCFDPDRPAQGHRTAIQAPRCRDDWFDQSSQSPRPIPSRWALPVVTILASVQLSTFRQCPLKYSFDTWTA